MQTGSPSSTVCFGAFQLNLRTGELFKRGRKIKLQAQSFLVLASLLERPGDVLTREELCMKLWPSDVFVDFEIGLNTAINRLRNVLDDSPGKPRFIETLPRRGYRFIAPLHRSSPGKVPHRIGSLAVLPLENLTGDLAQEYFVDGMTDALITRLAQIGALRVISRTSAMHYKGTHKRLPEIAGELDVDAIVEGTVTRSGHRVRISVQLVHTPTDQHLWAKQYQRELTDILVLQADVASAIAREIQVALTPRELNRLQQTSPVNPEAYQAFLRGRFFWNKRTGDGLQAGLENFQRSVQQDPTYAFAQIGLSESYSMQAYWGLAAPHEISPKAKAAADKAIEIDEELGEGHAARGWVLFAYEWKWAEAERELRRAIELNPGYATAHQWYSHLLAYQGRSAEALGEVQRTLELDPLSLVMNSNAAYIHLLARRYGDAIDCAQRTLGLHPNHPAPYLWLGWACAETGQMVESINHYLRAVKFSKGAARFISGLGHGYAVAGKAADARKMLGRLVWMTRKCYVSAYDFAVVHAGLRDKEAVFNCLEKACEERSPWLCSLRGDARFDAIRSDPRFKKILARLGLGH